jgi:Protein of unknown function (DUF2911)
MMSLVLTVSFCLAGSARAQSFVLDLPLRSPQAEVSQRIGLTDITIRYHRPLVNGRAIWGDLVPYGKVWRVGANINTTITFSDPVTVEGKPLDAGTYGLHMIPNPDRWTVIFSTNSTSWGSFTYAASEDALRVEVKPEREEQHEALTFEFDELAKDSAVVKMEWEKIAVPFRIGVDVHGLVGSSLKRQLRTLARYNWMSWNDAAGYLLSESTALDDALAYANRSITNEDRFENETTKSKILTALNRQPESRIAERRALELGSASQDHDFALELLKANRDQDAFAILRENAKRHPDEWIAHEGLARVYSGQGKFVEAVKEMRLAVSAAPDDQKSDLSALAGKLEQHQDINHL